MSLYDNYKSKLDSGTKKESPKDSFLSKTARTILPKSLETKFGVKQAPVKVPDLAPAKSLYSSFQSGTGMFEGKTKSMDTPTPVKKTSIPNPLNIFERPTYRKEGDFSFGKEFLAALPENVPFGFGTAIKEIRDNPELAAQITWDDVKKNILPVTAEFVAGFATKPASYFLTFAGLGESLYKAAETRSFKNFGQGAEISFDTNAFNIPGVGKVTNVQARIANDFAYKPVPTTGLGTTGVTALYAGEELLNGLFLSEIARAPFVARPSIIGSQTKPRSEVSGVDNLVPKPKSFRLYETPTIDSPVYRRMTPEGVENLMRGGTPINLNKYDPKLPTFFRLRAGSGDTLIGEVVQIKPSYWDRLTTTSFVNQAGSASADQVIQRISTSEGTDVQRAIKSGDIPREMVYKEGNVLKPEFAQGRIDDMAQKLEMYKPGLGDQFRAQVDVKNVTMTGNVPEGLKSTAISLVNQSLPKVPTPPPTSSGIIPLPPYGQGLSPDIPNEGVTVLTSKETNIPKLHDSIKKDLRDNTINASIGSVPKKVGGNIQQIIVPQTNGGLKITGISFNPGEVNGPVLEQIISIQGLIPSDSYVASNESTTILKLVNDIKKRLDEGAISQAATTVADETVTKLEEVQKNIETLTKTIEEKLRPQLTLKPTSVKDSKELKVEVAKIGIDTTKLKVGEPVYIRQPIGKTELKTLMDNSKEFSSNPVLKVDADKNLIFEGKATRFKLKSSAIGLNPSNLKVGDTININRKDLSVKGTGQQLRVVTPSGVLASVKGGKKSINDIIQNKVTKPVPETAQEIPSGFKVSEEVKKILNSMNIPVSEKTLSSRFLGVYKHLTKNVRLQSMYDVTTAMHEGVHGIDDQIGFSKRLITETGRGATLRKQLTDIYEDLYPTGKRTHKLDTRIKEGLAVLFENYFFDPVGITAKYPELVDTFIKPTGDYYSPKFTELLDKMNNLVDAYAKLPPEERIGSRIRTGKEIVDKDSGFTLWQRAIFETFSGFEPLKRYAKQAGVTETWNDPTVSAFNNLRKTAIVSQWYQGGVTPIIQPDGNWIFPKGSVGDWIKMVKGSEKEFRSYLVARRVVAEHNRIAQYENEINDLKEIGVDELEDTDNNAEELTNLIESKDRLVKILDADDFSLQDATAVINKYADKFKEPAKLFDDINNRLLDFAKNTGLKDAKTIDKWKSEEGYVSFRRYIEDELSGNDVGPGGGGAARPSSFKERVGSKLDIIDPGYNQLRSIEEIVGKGLRNMVWVKVDEMSKTMTEIARRFEPIETLVSVDGKGNISYPQMSNPDFINFYKGGKIQFRKAAPEFQAVAQFMSGQEMEAFERFAQLASGTFTRLTTSANPFWALSNLTVDQFSAASNTKLGMKPIIDPIISLKEMTTRLFGSDKAVLDSYEILGGRRQTLAASLDMSPDEISRKLSGQENKVEKVGKWVDSALGILELPTNTTEIMTRFSEYRRAIDNGVDMSVAMYRASEVTVPFEQRGNFGGPKGKAVLRSIPYANASLQVAYKFARASRDNPKRVGTVFSVVMMAGLVSAIATMQSATEKQKRLMANQYAGTLASNIMIPSPDGETLIRLKVPTEFGGAMATVQMFVFSQYGKNQATFDDYLTVITASVPTQLNLLKPDQALISWIPEAVKPSLQVAVNRKSYPEIAPIVPDYMTQTLPKKLQYTDYTSKTAKWLGQITNSSPAKIDYWVQNQFGPVGAFVFGGKLPATPMIVSEERAVLSGRAINRFYDERDLATQQYNEMKRNLSSYNEDEISQIMVNYKVRNKTADILGELRKINQEKPLPEDVREAAFELLISLGTKEDAADSIDLLQKLGQLTSDLKE